VVERGINDITFEAEMAMLHQPVGFDALEERPPLPTPPLLSIDDERFIRLL
jgi:hypothetical protein